MFSSLTIGTVAFIVGALVIVTAGSRLARVADELADRTGLGEALFGIFLLAGVTSLPDFAATLSAAMDSRPDLAMSNIMGSMAAKLVLFSVDFAEIEALQHKGDWPATADILSGAALSIPPFRSTTQRRFTLPRRSNRP